jgi:hypothetical protein
MKSKTKKGYRLGLGEILLLTYLVVVIAIAILRALTGFPTISELASSPALLMHGQWWRLITSAFVIDGPPLPQLVAIGVLGTLGIYFGGSWTFWSTALAGHFLGTLIAYAGVAVVWFQDQALVAKYITDPDYGVSLIWCAALGAFAVMVWLGKGIKWSYMTRIVTVALALSAMVVVTAFSDKMAAAQHALAFLIGGFIVGTADRSVELQRSRRPILLNSSAKSR